MNSIRWLELCMLLGSYNCAPVSKPETAADPVEEILVPLDLPPEYQDRVQSVVPQLLGSLGIPKELVPDDGLLPSMSNLSNGFGYFNSETNSEQDSACKSKLVEGRLKLTKNGISMCKKRCLDSSKERVSMIRSILETFNDGTDEKRIEADIELQTEKKAYECVLNDDRYDCVCMKNEILKVTPSLKSLIYQLFKGGDKRRKLIKHQSKGEILLMIFLLLIETAVKLAKFPFVFGFKIMRNFYHFMKWIL